MDIVTTANPVINQDEPVKKRPGMMFNQAEGINRMPGALQKKFRGFRGSGKDGLPGGPDKIIKSSKLKSINMHAIRRSG
tara:strand:- start:1143 stop:1379 length:237 start_codon:yes stop_codon:yes gene_type:complete